jgi:hypothetical protein
MRSLPCTFVALTWEGCRPARRSGEAPEGRRQGLSPPTAATIAKFYPDVAFGATLAQCMIKDYEYHGRVIREAGMS